MEVPSLGEFAAKDWPKPEKGFASMIRNIDRDMGKLFARLKELGIDDNTIVFFSSDNGPHQEGGHQMPFFDSNGDLLGMKRDLYEGTLRSSRRFAGLCSASMVSREVRPSLVVGVRALDRVQLRYRISNAGIQAFVSRRR
jgi:hypothetical protein